MPGSVGSIHEANITPPETPRTDGHGPQGPTQSEPEFSPDRVVSNGGGGDNKNIPQPEEQTPANDKSKQKNWFMRHPIVYTGVGTSVLGIIAGLAAGIPIGSSAEKFGVEHNFSPMTVPQAPQVNYNQKGGN